MLFTVRYSHGNYNATVIFVCMAITLLTIFEVNTTIQHHISISVALIGQYITSIAFTQVHWITYSAHTPMSATLDYSYDPLLSESITFSRESRYFGTSNLQRNTTLRRGTSYGTMGAVQELDEGQENEDDEDDDQEAFIKVNVDMKAVRQQRAPYLFMRERIGEDAAETSTQGNDADDGDDEEDDQDMEALLAFQDARRQQVYAFSPTASSAVIPARSMLSPQALPSDSSAANRTPLSWAFQPKDSYSSSYDMRMAAAGSGIAAIGNGPAGGQTVGYPARKRVNRSNLKNNAIGRRTWTGGHSIIYSGIFLESSGDESESVEKEDDEGGNTSEDSFDEKDDPSLLKSDTEDSKLDEESKDPGMQPKPRVLNPEEIPAQGGIPTESQSSDATIATTTDPWVGSDSNEPSECNAQHHQLEKEVVTETHEERQRLKETKRRTIIREYGILGTDGATVKDNTAVIEGDMIVVLDTTTAGVESGEQNIKVEVIDVDVNGECTPSSPGISKEDPKKPTVQAICTDDSFTHTGSSIKENGSQGHRSEKNDATGHREPQEIDHETQLDGHHGLSTVTFNVSSSKQITAVICEDENCEDHPFQEGPAAELESVLGPGITKGNVVHLDIKESSTSAMERTGDGINDFEDESDSGTVQPQPRRRHDELPGIDTIPVECERIRSELEKTHEESQGDGPGSRGIRIRGRTEKTTMELETDKPFDPNDPSSLLIGPGAVLKPGEPHREITTTEEGVDEEGGYRRIHIKERIEKITVEEECSGSSSDSDSDHDHIVPIVATRLGRRNSGGVIVPGGVIIVDERPLPPLPVVQPVPGGRVEGDPDRRPGVVTWGVVSDYPENFIQPGSEPLVLGPPYGAVRRPLYPVAVSPGPDIMIADPRVTLTDPRMIIPEPMVVIPQPIVAISEPTVYIPNPTVAIPESTIAIPEPMIVIPQPRIAPPVPQLQPRRVPVAPPSQPVFQPPPPRVLPPPPPRVLPPPQPAIIPPQRPIVHPPPLPTLVPPVIQHPPLPVVAPPVQPVVPPVRGIVGPGPPIVQGSRGIAVANTHPLVGHGPVPAVVPGYGGYGGHGGHGGYGGYGAYGHGAYGPGAPSDIVSIDGRYSVASIYEDEAYSVASVYDDRSIASIEGRGFVPAPAHGNMMMGGPMYNTGPYMPRGQYGPYGHPQMVTAGHVTRSREHQEEYQDQRGYSNQERGQDAFHHNRHISRESDSMEGTMSTEGLPLYDDREHQNHDRLVRVQHMDRSSDMDGSDILSEDFVNSRPVSDNYSEATSQEIPYQEAVVNDGQLEMKEMAIETYYDTTKSQFKTREKKEQLLTEMAMRIKSIQTDQRQNDEQQQQRQLQFGEGRALGDSLTQGSVASHSTASSMIFSQSPVSTLSLSLQTRNLQQSPPVFTIPKPPTNPPPVRLLANRNVAATLGSSPTPVLERSPIGGRRTAITPTTTRVDNADTANVVKAISLLSNSAEMVAARDRNTEEPILSSSSTNVETILMQARRPKDDDPSISSANGHALKPQMETTTPKPRQLISHSTMMNGASADNEVGVSTRTSTAAAIQRLKERQDALNAAMMSHIIASKAPKKTRRRPHYPPMSREQLHPSLLNEGILACWNNEFGSALEIFNEHSATYPRWSLAAAEVRTLYVGQQTEADSDLIEALQQAEKVSSKVLDRKTEFHGCKPSDSERQHSATKLQMGLRYGIL
ncbi:hypothetical protein BGW38_010935 [Lunasporangiospora selenospora]|uniref:Uncharacterized protein n=1 Tax=Lunasporangiospora selenospora TaxID=979761 RepID=A0A9P6FVI9_9FUNG|nr:hypothetical protein BGW38_010935 [Lunasporangiospora selenospora]